MPRRRDRMLALGGLLPVAGLLYGVVARPRINQWGATDQEHRATWPGDRLLARPDYVWTNAVIIERLVEQVWPWLVQLGQTRLLIRSRGSSRMGRIQGPIQFVMQRKAMVGIKQRAEGTWSPSPVDVIEPLLWLLTAGVLATASVRVLVQREQWWRPYLVA
ncbi:MAG: hypothetical protein K0S88_3655, partial [Actinomycetia bacterium]|nr:hypothetical protein [Actinomycetes bacterium]